MNNTSVKPNLAVFKDKIFEGIIGQDSAKREVNFHLDSYIHTRYIANLMLVAPRGQGKTKLARAIAKGLFQFDELGRPMMVPSKKDPTKLVPKRKALVEINCSSIKNLKAFINSILVKYVVDKDVTLFFDEASELPHDVSMALLTMLENNPTHKTQYAYDEYVVDLDFHRQTFIFATTETQKVFHALMDRLERVTLSDYSSKDLSQIIKINLPDVQVDDNLLLDIASVTRGNARAAHKMSEKIMAYLQGSKVFSKRDWNSLRKILTITPLGLNALEVQILRVLRENPQGTSLTGLSAKTGMTREALRQDSEIYLLKHNLMEITTTGRNVTAKGIEYLKNLDAELAS